MLKIKTIVFLVSFALAAIGSQQAMAAGFVCPVIHSANAPAVAEPIGALMSSIDDATENNKINEIVSQLRASGMTPGLIVDNLVGAYCPIVEHAALSDEQKTFQVRRFARQVAALVYGPVDQTETMILIDVPIKPNILIQIDQAARRANISRDVWIERSISEALQAPQ